MESVVEEPSCSSDGKIGPKLAPFNPTNIEAIHMALKLLNINSDDVLYDIGCGDGRCLVEACKINDGIRCVGVEYDLELCIRARKSIFENGFSDRITIVHGNALEVDLSSATCMFIYLVNTGLQQLASELKKALDDDVRIVTYVFALPGEIPNKVELYKKSTKLYYYNKKEPRDEGATN